MTIGGEGEIGHQAALARGKRRICGPEVLLSSQRLAHHRQLCIASLDKTTLITSNLMKHRIRRVRCGKCISCMQKQSKQAMVPTYAGTEYYLHMVARICCNSIHVLVLRQFGSSKLPHEQTHSMIFYPVLPLGGAEDNPISLRSLSFPIIRQRPRKTRQA